jgi:hypothetical protein
MMAMMMMIGFSVEPKQKRYKTSCEENKKAGSHSHAGKPVSRSRYM